MSEDLVEALARRLAHVTQANPAYPGYAYDVNWEMYMDAARECLRQMEWARRGDPNAKSQNFAPEPGDEIIRDPLIGKGFTPLSWVPMTLAPDDWTP